MAFSTKIKGTHHLQGNVQVYNVRIPVSFMTLGSSSELGSWSRSEPLVRSKQTLVAAPADRFREQRPVIESKWAWFLQLQGEPKGLSPK